MDWLDFSYVEKHIVFNAKVNRDIPLRLLLDTGAGLSATFGSVVGSLGLPEQKRGDEVETIFGPEGQRGTTVFSSLTTGTVEHSDAVFLILPDRLHADSSFDAVVGFNVLGKMKILINFPQRRLSLLQEGEPVPATSAELVRFDIREDVPIIHAEIDSQPMDALVDSGSGESVIFGKPVPECEKRRVCWIGLGTEFSLCADFAVQETSQLSRGLGIGAILGNNVWDECILLIDYARGVLGIKGDCEKSLQAR